jgi:hypothetical protein
MGLNDRVKNRITYFQQVILPDNLQILPDNLQKLSDFEVLTIFNHSESLTLENRPLCLGHETLLLTFQRTFAECRVLERLTTS